MDSIIATAKVYCVSDYRAFFAYKPVISLSSSYFCLIPNIKQTPLEDDGVITIAGVNNPKIKNTNWRAADYGIVTFPSPNKAKCIENPEPRTTNATQPNNRVIPGSRVNAGVRIVSNDYTIALKSVGSVPLYKVVSLTRCQYSAKYPESLREKCASTYRCYEHILSLQCIDIRVNLNSEIRNAVGFLIELILRKDCHGGSRGLFTKKWHGISFAASDLSQGLEKYNKVHPKSLFSSRPRSLTW